MARSENATRLAKVDIFGGTAALVGRRFCTRRVFARGKISTRWRRFSLISAEPLGVACSQSFRWLALIAVLLFLLLDSEERRAREFRAKLSAQDALLLHSSRFCSVRAGKKPDVYFYRDKTRRARALIA